MAPVHICLDNQTLPFHTSQAEPDLQTARTYISMTTTPERLRDEWFYTNLRKTLALLRDASKLIESVSETKSPQTATRAGMASSPSQAWSSDGRCALCAALPHKSTAHMRLELPPKCHITRPRISSRKP